MKSGQLKLTLTIIAYLTRGRGNRVQLLKEIRESPSLGPRMANWLENNEAKLREHLLIKPKRAEVTSMAQSQPPVKPRSGPALTPSQLRAERQAPRPKDKPASKGHIDSGTRQIDNRAAPVKNLGGAGGNWRVIDEVADSSVVKQLNELSCGQACVSMMLGDRKISATQDVIAKLAGNGPTYEAQLASVLNKVDSSGARQWIGAGVDAEDLATFHGLTSTGSWAAQFWEKGNKVGHWVVVDGLDDTGRVMIRDPWQATRYKMDLQDFQHTWTGYSVWGQ